MITGEIPPPHIRKYELTSVYFVRLLTLPSGWRIQFGSNVNFIFETHDLSNASPATISRMGIINLSAEDLNSNLIIDSWLALHNSDDTLSYYFDNYFNRAIEWIENNQYMYDLMLLEQPFCLFHDISSCFFSLSDQKIFQKSV